MICEYNIFSEMKEGLREKRIKKATRDLFNFLIDCQDFPNFIDHKMTKGESFAKLRKLLDNKYVDANQRMGNLEFVR